MRPNLIYIDTKHNWKKCWCW